MKSYLAINIQHYENNLLCVKTIAVKDTEERHKSEYLKRLIQKMPNWSIKKRNFLSFNVDNASNMFMSINLVNNDEEEEVEEEDDDQHLEAEQQGNAEALM